MKRENDLMLFGLNSNQHSLKGIGLFLFIYVGASLFAALLTAPAYWAVEWLNSINSTETTRWLLGKNIDIYYDRLRWAPIILGLPWMMKECKLFSIRNLGLPISLKSLSVFIKCFIVGIILSVGIFTLQYFFCDVQLRPNLTSVYLGQKLLSALAAGLILGFLEELVFRCLIMRSLYTAFETWSAIILSSLFFAYKHFKVPNSVFDALPGGVHSSTWDIGFFVSYYDTIGIKMDFSLMPFLSLFMFGMVLCMLYIRTRKLWAPIAMHAGIVMSIQIYRSAFEIKHSANQIFFGNAGMTNGYAALAALTIIFLWLLFLYPKKNSQNA